MDTKVLIGVPTAEYARRADFYDYLNLLLKPAGTELFMSHGQSPARNRNLMIRHFLDNKFTHLLFIDDDVAFKSDLLMNLLNHDLDIITGLYVMRAYPHQPIIFDSTKVEGQYPYHFLQDHETGLIEIQNCGLGACLIKRKVFESFSSEEYPIIRLGECESEKDHWCDDIGFFIRVRAKGFKLFCDLDIKVGHMASCTIWPDYRDGKWYTNYETMGTGSVSFPVVRPS